MHCATIILYSDFIFNLYSIYREEFLMKKTKKILCTLLLCALVLTSFAPVGNASAKGKVKLSTTKMVTSVH